MNVSIPSMATKTEDATSTDKAYSNGRDRENKYSSGQKPSARTRKRRRRNKEKPLCNGCGQREELL